jgi:hypothetical protein
MGVSIQNALALPWRTLFPYDKVRVVSLRTKDAP